MCNSCNSCGNRGCGCPFFNNLARAIENLFDTQPYCNGCGCNGNGNGCGCGCNGNGNTRNGNNGNNGCGCNGNGNGNNGCGCGCNGNGNGTFFFNDLSAYTACGEYDCYYARQYALYPFNIANGICSCCNN